MKSSWSVFIVSIQKLFGIVSIQDLFGVVSIQNLFGFVSIQNVVGVVHIQDLFEKLNYLLAGSNHGAMLVDLNNGVVLRVADHVDNCSCSF